MGTYLKIPKKISKTKLKRWFDNWKPFYNDFGQKHTFKDIFGDTLTTGEINFKIEGGCPLKEIYSKEAVEEIKEIIIKNKGNFKTF